MPKKSILILGATSDVARELAYQYAGTGHEVLLAARDKSHVKNLSNDVSIRYNINCEFYEFDINQIDQHPLFIDNLSHLPNITICLIGYLGDNEKAKTDWSEASKILSTNYLSVVSIINLIGEKYQTRKAGKIAVFSSVAGERGRQSNYHYGSAKAGLTAYLSGMRNSMQPHNVHVLTIKPGFIATKMTEDMELPKLLTATPKQVAISTVKGIENSKNVIYTRWFWRYIMLVIKLIPEGIFKRLKL